MLDFLMEHQDVWDRLSKEKRPIVLYGMGDGAQKILNVFADKGIQIADIFASDEFVRGHSFAGYKVLKLSEVQAKYKDFVVVISFASQRPDVLKKLNDLDVQYTTVAPDVPVAGGGLFDLEYIRAHRTEIEQVYHLMADNISKSVFSAIINYKISGKLCYLKDCHTDKLESFTTIIKPHNKEYFVDLGAYNGDTIRELLSYTDGSCAGITAFEPDVKNYKKLTAFCIEANLSNVNLQNAAAWSCNGTLLFEGKAGRNSALSKKQGIETQVKSVDSVLNGAPATIMKFDVEGAEREAILGAQNTIKIWKPRMNIAVYHRNEDIFVLPLLVHQLCPEYKLYLRHHPYIPAWDTNLYTCL